jgi:hypothetical protein
MLIFFSFCYFFFSLLISDNFVNKKKNGVNFSDKQAQDLSPVSVPILYFRLPRTI